MHALTTSAKSVVLAGASTIQILSEKKEMLTQRIDTLRAELQALNRTHVTTIASLQAEEKKWDLGLTDQQAKNDALQIQNNELSSKVTRYQTKLAAHRCPQGWKVRFPTPGLNFWRAAYRERGVSIENFLHLL